MRLKVRQDGDPCLRIKSKPLKDITSAQRMLFKAMFEAMYDNQGVGLAAPQVGINERFFVVDIGEGTDPFVVVNPQILEVKGECVMAEGCLSVKDRTVAIKRPKEILVRYTTEENIEVEQRHRDLMARVFLHEIDHLDGKLILDYAILPENIAYQKSSKSKTAHREQL
ncbi:MAG: peptide deformylase [Candidatus Omnitrophica bacterium]|nr:peptide deformylase [Candidatus Omnitrophota bacterium]